MPTLVQHDRDRNQLHLVFRRERIVALTEWIAPNATMDFAADGEVVGINIFDYYTAPVWPLTEELVELFNLGEHLEDLRLVWQAFFAPPEYKVKVLKYEGPDGNEIVLPVDG